jgi:sulfatase modifying factor 1
MDELVYQWTAAGEPHELRMMHVEGTSDEPFLFGENEPHVPVEVPSFYLGSTPVTQALWEHVTGNDPALVQTDRRLPVENVSWQHITEPGGFLDQINVSVVVHDLSAMAGCDLRFRLPTETEWEYAARGGRFWRDEYTYSGSNDVREVAWCGPIWGGRGWHQWRSVNARRRLMKKLLPWLYETRTHPVGLKKPNQLGLYDMSGNVWEWCEDVVTDDVALLPRDGSAYTGPGDERRLRGGCHHNWDIHCTVSKRYGIQPDAHDGCIGLRLVLS